MKIAEKRKAGEILCRDGISERILEIARDIVNEKSYKNAIIRAGQISVLVEAASYDEYWNEKASMGKCSEEAILSDLNKDYLKRDWVISKADPYT